MEGREASAGKVVQEAFAQNRLWPLGRALQGVAKACITDMIGRCPAGRQAPRQMLHKGALYGYAADHLLRKHLPIARACDLAPPSRAQQLEAAHRPSDPTVRSADVLPGSTIRPCLAQRPSLVRAQRAAQLPVRHRKFYF